MDEHASRSYAANFHGDRAGRQSRAHAEPKDITQLDPDELVSRYGHSAQDVDLIVGGPPCPTFTRVGRAKLREIHQHPEAFLRDPRAQLYLHYIQFVEQLRPVAIVMENVPDLLNYGGRNVAEDVCDALETMGYRCAYTLLNAANYGVPQMRERVFIVGLHEAVQGPISFPTPTAQVDFPPGYAGSRDVALRGIRMSQQSIFEPQPRYVHTPLASENASSPTTVREAIGDLPPITAHLSGDMKRGARRFDIPIPYRSNGSGSRYTQQMRKWPGFEGADVLFDHVTRSLSSRDYRLFREMQHGDQYPEVHDLALRLFGEALAEARAEGAPLQEGSAAYEDLKKEFVPPYDPAKFPNKWRKMEPDEPARTLMAHLGKDSYSHIHYDSEQARVITVREAARLQSFPDGFRFSGTMNPAFRQIGNAVPPLMAFALARHLLKHLEANQ